jgi:hypothetical protein
LLIFAAVVPTLYWIFNGDAYCQAPRQNERNFSPTISGQIEAQRSAKPKAKDFPDHWSFSGRLTHSENEKNDSDRNKSNADKNPSARVVDLLCEAKLTDLLLALFTYCLVIVGAFQAWYLLDAGTTARDTAEAAKIQTRAMVAKELPIVAWSDFKLVQYDANDQVAGEVRSGLVPTHCRPVFELINTGPTKIVLRYSAIKWEITDELGKEPHFGGMAGEFGILLPDHRRAITTSLVIHPSEGERRALEDGSKTLYAYAFVVYVDYLDEAHQIGTIVKWDPVRGFVVIERPNYSYTRSERRYTQG